MGVELGLGDDDRVGVGWMDDERCHAASDDTTRRDDYGLVLAHDGWCWIYPLGFGLLLGSAGL